MIRLLSAIGREIIIVAALLTIVGFVVGGYGMGTGTSRPGRGEG
jgi:hypothetical protein